MKRTQSRPNFISKETSPLKKMDSVTDYETRPQPRGTKHTDEVGDLLMRHNSYSLLTDSKRELQRPKMIKIDTAIDNVIKDPSSTRLKNYHNKPESNYSKFKKTVVKKRSSNMLFSQLGFIAETKPPSTRIDALLNNRKIHESGSINLKQNGAYLMGRLSPHSQASIGDNFRLDFLDHSTSGAHQERNGRKQLGLVPSLATTIQEKPFKNRVGSKTKQTMDDLEDSESSTTLSNLESNMTTLTSKMKSTASRLAKFITDCKQEQQDKLSRFEAMARENGILREKLKALERRQG